MIRYAKYFDSNKTMSFKVNDEELFRKYTEILEKISSSIGKNFLVNLFIVIMINT